MIAGRIGDGEQGPKSMAKAYGRVTAHLTNSHTTEGDVGFQGCGQVPGRSRETFTNQSQETFTNQSQETSRQDTTMLRKGLVKWVTDVVDGAGGGG